MNGFALHAGLADSRDNRLIDLAHAQIPMCVTPSRFPAKYSPAGSTPIVQRVLPNATNRGAELEISAHANTQRVTGNERHPPETLCVSMLARIMPTS